tara:strand:- start:11472 stop:11792 length:321 start_codon:yes stop_codon:yes gene_type:complete
MESFHTGLEMNKVTVNITSENGYRASETIADLRNAAETLYFPMKLAGFWDSRDGIHLCPEEERHKACSHLGEESKALAEYANLLQRDRQANLEVFFTHAGVRIFLC